MNQDRSEREHRGLIESEQVKVYGSGASAIDSIPMHVMVYTVPLDVHYAWCLWASEQPDGEAE